MFTEYQKNYCNRILIYVNIDIDYEYITMYATQLSPENTIHYLDAYDISNN